METQAKPQATSSVCFNLAYLLFSISLLASFAKSNFMESIFNFNKSITFYLFEVSMIGMLVAIMLGWYGWVKFNPEERKLWKPSRWARAALVGTVLFGVVCVLGDIYLLALH